MSRSLGDAWRQADSDGCATWPAKETIARLRDVLSKARTRSASMSKLNWRNLLKRQLIGKGDQSLVRHYRADRRPVVYDLLIPHDWFPNLGRVNRERDRKGRGPREANPPHTAPPRRAKRRGKPAAPTRGTQDPVRPPKHPRTTSRPRENYKFRGTRSPKKPNPVRTPRPFPRKTTPPVRPSVHLRWVRARLRARTEGRTGAARWSRRSCRAGRVAGCQLRLAPRRPMTTAQLRGRGSAGVVPRLPRHWW